VGPFGLDGQFDFVLYHGVSYSTFAYGDKGMIHADYWTQCSQQKFKNAIMTPYIGSHDTARFVTLADYRGQDGAHPRSTASNQWDNTAVAPSESYPYENLRIGMAWLLTLPGAPLLYYGDEYGQWGGVDPNNRLLWRAEGALNADETATLAFVRKVGRARADVPALRRGEYVSLLNTSEDTLVFGRRVSPGVAAIVALTRAATPQNVSVEVATSLGFASGTVLHDRMGGPDVTVAGGNLALPIPARGAIILAP
jgi:neopullulanase